MEIRKFNKILIFFSSLFIMLSLISGVHLKYSKNADNMEFIKIESNNAQASTWSYVDSYGVYMNMGSYNYSVYMDGDYDYQFRQTYSDRGYSGIFLRSIQSTPYYAIADNNTNDHVYSKIHNYDVSPDTSGYYILDTTDSVYDLYKTPKIKPFVQYGETLTPINNYQTSCYYYNKFEYDTDRRGRPEYRVYQSGIKDLNLGTIKYDSLSRTFTGVINSFSGVMTPYGSYAGNYNFNIYIVDAQGTKTSIFYKHDNGSEIEPLRVSRNMSAIDVNKPIKLEMVVSKSYGQEHDMPIGTSIIVDIPFVDTNPPTTPTLIASPMGWTNKNTTIIASSTDDTGIKGYQFSLDNLNWSDTTSGRYVNTVEGARLLYCKAVDIYDNKSPSANIMIYKDCTNPLTPISSIQNITNTGYDVYVYGVVDDINLTNSTLGSGINDVKFSIWTENKGKDDIKLESGTNIGSNTWHYRVNTNDHNNEYSLYNTQIYIYDNSGNFISINSNIFPVMISVSPKLTIITPSNDSIYSN